jgi:hypothetical protein
MFPFKGDHIIGRFSKMVVSGSFDKNKMNTNINKVN